MTWIVAFITASTSGNARMSVVDDRAGARRRRISTGGACKPSQ
jgi:hypothetical protein